MSTTPQLLRELGRLRVEFSRRAAGETGPDQEEAASGLGDFGEHLLPALVDRGKGVQRRHRRLLARCGPPEAYLAAHRDLLAGRVDAFDHPDRPVLTMSTGRLPARVYSGAVVANSLLGAGSRVSGTVEGSVLGTDVVVHRGAVVRNSVLFDGVVVHPGARVGTAILDENVQVRGGAVIGADIGRRTARDADIVLVGQGSRIGRKVTIGEGARLEPGTTA